MNDRPVLHVVRGEPTAEELAVLTAVMTAASSAEAAPDAPRRGRWSDPAHRLRQPLWPGPGGWRAAF